ncbi:MAG TPA: ferric reductase-like transmembrane domain-containing protein [Solirubrobacteraceae bacterium]|jgi:predicted ferric reductase|nr:ferric reductase-like transmembrane domain-containing protein [Solirubrobacteraceae bacterium]
MPIGAIGSSSTAFWYLTRASGVVSLLLLTLVVALGVADVARVSSPYWPRFLTDGVHRRASMLALVFLAIHIVTSVLDTYAPISLLDAFIPFHSAYRPLWLGLGAAAFDLLLAVLVTSLLRSRIGARNWRLIHWMAYACWPLAVIHGLGTGSDVRRGWMLALDVICVAVVLGAVWARVRMAEYPTTAARATAAGLSAAFVLGLAIWLPGGPLAAGWAGRAGTPVKLISSLHSGSPARTGSR